MTRTAILLALSFSTAALVAGCEPEPHEPPAPPAERANEPLDLADWDDNDLAFLKARGSLNPDEDVVFWWTGSIYLVRDADPFGPPVTDFPGPILRFEGFNIARFEPVADGTRMGDEVVFNTEIDLNYASPLPIDSYPEYSASNTYSGTELFNWYADRADLEDPTLDSVPVTISWSRVGQLLPWMQAGQTGGKLV